MLEIGTTRDVHGTIFLNPIQPNPPAYWPNPIQSSVHSIDENIIKYVSEFDFICAVNAACW